MNFAGMRQVEADIGLLHESLVGRRAFPETGIDEFQRNGPGQAFVAGQIDAAHAATQQALDTDGVE